MVMAMSDVWNLINNWLTATRAGQVVSLNSLLGACHKVPLHNWSRQRLLSRMCSYRGKSLLPADYIVQHHTLEVLLHHTVNGNVSFPIMGDIQDIDSCPVNVASDFIHMWCVVNENLLGISLTTPSFSYGTIDYESWKIGPKFSLTPQLILVHTNVKDPLHRLYCGFIYLPKQFRMTTQRMHQNRLSTDKFCWNSLRDSVLHLHTHIKAPEEFLRANCIPHPDK